MSRERSLPLKSVAENALTVLDDCRRHFKPLTELEPPDALSPCTIVVKPGKGWEEPLLKLIGKNGALDAEICFPVGTYPVSSPVVISSTGNIKVSGAGWGTQLVGSVGVESVLQFNGCASVVVRDLRATAPTVHGAPYGAAKASRAIHGTLDFNNCGEVLVENVSLTCGAALLPGAACLVVRSDPTANTATGSGNTRIRGSHFAVGEMQYGILLVHQARAFVDENTITVDGSSKIPWATKIESPVFQRVLARVFLSNAVVSNPVVAKPEPEKAGVAGILSKVVNKKAVVKASPVTHPLAAVTVGKTTVHFQAPAEIAPVLQTYVDLHGPKEFANPNDLHAYLKSVAMALATKPAVRAEFSTAQRLIESLEQNDVAIGARGIAVGGRAITELRIRENSIDHMLQGVTVGVSHEEKPKEKSPDSMQYVTISGNVIGVMLNAVRGHAMARWAIFVGNAQNVSIERNEVSLSSPGKRVQLASDGIRVWGYLGPKMIISENHVSGFTRDIVVHALLPIAQRSSTQYWYYKPSLPVQLKGTPEQGASTNLWLVVNNYVASNDILAPACVIGQNWPGLPIPQASS